MLSVCTLAVLICYVE